MKKIAIFSIIALILVTGPVALAHSGQGQLIKSANSSAVYLAEDTFRYVFPDAKTYQSWYGDDFSQINTISSQELSSYQLKGTVTHKPGSLIKIQTDPKVYEILDSDGSISWVQTEEAAIEKFGANWASLVSDVPASFFVNYAIIEDQTPTEPEEPPVEPQQPEPTTFDQSAAQPSQEPSLLIRLTNNQVKDDDADIIWNDSNYAFVWVEGDDLYFSYTNTNLQVGPKTKINNISSKVSSPKIAWEGTYYLIAWNGQNGDEANLYFSKMDLGGRVWISEKKLATIDNDSKISLAGIYDNTVPKYAVVWDQVPTNNNGKKEIFIANLDDVGTIKNAPVQVTGSDSIDSVDPKIILNAEDFGVFWQDSRNTNNDEIYYTRFDTNGTKLIDDVRVTNAEGLSQSPSIVWDGTYYAIIFYDTRGGGDYYLQQVYANGTNNFTQAVKITSPAGQASGGAAITYLNNYYYAAVAYKTASPKPDDGSEIYLLKLYTNGETYTSTRATYNPWPASNPIIVESDDSYGFIWTDSRATCQDCIYSDGKRDELYFLKINE